LYPKSGIFRKMGWRSGSNWPVIVRCCSLLQTLTALVAGIEMPFEFVLLPTVQSICKEVINEWGLPREGDVGRKPAGHGQT